MGCELRKRDVAARAEFLYPAPHFHVPNDGSRADWQIGDDRINPNIRFHLIDLKPAFTAKQASEANKAFSDREGFEPSVGFQSLINNDLRLLTLHAVGRDL